MSEIKTDKLSPRTGAGTVTLGTSGDSYTIPAGVTLTNAGTQTNTGTATIASGGTLTVASGATIDVTGATQTGFPSGGLQHITTVTNTVAASSIDLLNVFSATYNNYLVVMNGVYPVSNSVDCYIKFGNSDLSSIRADHAYAIAMYAVQGSATSYVGYGVAYGKLAQSQDYSTETGVNLAFSVFSPFLSGASTKWGGNGVTFNNLANWGMMSCQSGVVRGGPYSDPSFRIMFSSGNVAGDTDTKISVYGYAES